MAVVSQRTSRLGRWPELGMTIVAVLIVMAGYVLVSVNAGDGPPAALWPRTGLFLAAAIGVHLVVRWRAPHADPIILPVVILLNGIGLTMIYRLDFERDVSVVDRQLLWTGLGMILCVVVLVAFKDHRVLRRYPYLIGLAGIILLLLPMLPVIGQEINGARIWINLGGFSFQPAELAKIALCLFFASYLVSNRDNLALAGPRVLGMHLPRARHLGPILIVWVVCMAVLIVQRDLGTAVLFFGMFIAMMYVATERVSWVAIGALLAGGGIVIAAQIFPYVMARVDVWLNALEPEVYSRSPGGSFQVVQGMYGMASGGLMGTGLGEGHPYLVPYADSDFILATVGEELGLTGFMAVIVLFLLLVMRGLRASIAVRDGFGKLVAAGFAITMALQVFVVAGGVTRLIPLTGLTTPFMAAGGSSLVANWVIVAILLRISDAGRRPAPPMPTPPPAAATPVGRSGSDAKPISPSATTPAAPSADEADTAKRADDDTDIVSPPISESASAPDVDPLRQRPTSAMSPDRGRS